MSHNLIGARQHEDALAKATSRRLQIILWASWTLAVAAVAYLSWHADRAANHPLNVLGLVIHCVLAGMVGLVVLTLVEMRVEPWRFVD